MKSTPENQVKRLLHKALNELGCFKYSASAGPYSIGGIPDVIGCYKGVFFGVEVKAPGRRGQEHRGCSALQRRSLEDISLHGGIAVVVDCQEEIDEFIKLLKGR